MKKLLFWATRHERKNIAFTGDLAKYAPGDSLWQAILNLCEIHGLPAAVEDSQESDMDFRLKMFRETGVLKVEVFIEERAGKFAIRYSNTASIIDEKDEKLAVFKYLDIMARNSLENKHGRMA